MVSEALREIIQENTLLNRLVGTVRARAGIKLEGLRGELILLTGLTKDDRRTAFSKSILDLLEESGFIKISADSVSYVFKVAHGSFGTKEDADSAKPDENPAMDSQSGREGGAQVHRIPIPLGMNRLVYLELPADWNHKDLPKLLKLLQLSLGEDDS